MIKFKQYLEEMMGGGAVAAGPTNTAGSGAVASIGVGKDGEPGVHPKRKKKSPIMISMSRRKLPN